MMRELLKESESARRVAAAEAERQQSVAEARAIALQAEADVLRAAIADDLRRLRWSDGALHAEPMSEAEELAAKRALRAAGVASIPSVSALLDPLRERRHEIAAMVAAETTTGVEMSDVEAGAVRGAILTRTLTPMRTMTPRRCHPPREELSISDTPTHASVSDTRTNAL